MHLRKKTSCFRAFEIDCLEDISSRLVLNNWYGKDGKCIHVIMEHAGAEPGFIPSILKEDYTHQWTFLVQNG